MAEEFDLSRVICPLHELADPGSRGFTLGRGEWPLKGFVVRKGETVRAYVNHCPHAGYPLNWNPDQFLAPELAVIRCVMHGALFEVETGDCIVGPCVGHALQPLEIHVRNGYVILDDSVRLEDPN